MKRLIALLFALVFIPFNAFAESSEYDQYDTMKTLLETVFKGTGNGDAQITCNNSGFIIRQSNKDFTDTLLTAYIFDNSDLKNTWKEGQKELLDFYNSIYELIETCGIDNPNLLYMITDSTEPDEGDMIFFAISNGKIIYDMLAE